jgi:c-di-GMP-related signal transduction protein
MLSQSVELPQSTTVWSPKADKLDCFITRQPVFHADGTVYGYEMLFHSYPNATTLESEARLASLLVISNSFFFAGAGRLLSGKKAFLNFPGDMLMAGVPLLVPRKLLVVQIPDTVEVDQLLLSACGSLKDNGYFLALNNFFGQSHLEPLLNLVDIIKVNFQAVSDHDRRRLAEEHRKRGVTMLADRVETQEDFESARSAGYNYFQGFFFARPKLVAGRELGTFKRNYLRILAELHRPDLDFDALANLIKQEATLSAKLLQYINSAVFSFRGNVSSLHQALGLLGEKAVRQWVSAAALTKLAKEKPTELVNQSMLRARFCESIARHANLSVRQQPALFQIGMFSLLDAMLDRPLDDLLSGLPIASNVCSVLLGSAPAGDRWAEVLTSVRAYEAADWSTLSASAGRLGIADEVLPQLYLESVEWSSDVLRSASAA